jgi:hypothetical protein
MASSVARIMQLVSNSVRLKGEVMAYHTIKHVDWCPRWIRLLVRMSKPTILATLKLAHGSKSKI